MSDLVTASHVSLMYLPVAIGLGVLHALEPGHAKTVIAAYLIGTKGTRGDAILLGISAAATHSIIVILLAAVAVWLGRETFTGEAAYWLQIVSAGVVVLIGCWMLWQRVRLRYLAMNHHHDHESSDHHHDDEHACAHHVAMPTYVSTGERPRPRQIIAFGAAGGLVPCPASVSIMILAVSVGQTWMGLAAVLCFSAGLAIAMVSVGLLVVSGFKQLTKPGRATSIARYAPWISATAIIVSGLFAIALTIGTQH